MADWRFWDEKGFSNVYENIYIRCVRDDWYNIVSEFTKQINSLKKENQLLLDIGCGEGHTTKQILDRINGSYKCDLLEPDRNALSTAKAFLKQENNIGETFPISLAKFKPNKKYDIIFTSHTNYYWASNQKDYDIQLTRLTELLNKNGKLIILTLPENSEHYQIMLRDIYPRFNYAEYIINFYKEMSLKVDVEKLQMKMFVGDILSTDKRFELNTFYKFIHNTSTIPDAKESSEFLKKIQNYQKNNYLDFKDYLIVVSK